MLGVCIAALGGCRHGAAVQAATARRDSPACDFTTQLDRWLGGVRGRFGEQGFDPMLDEFKTHFKVVHTDNRTFFSYRAECFMDNGLWLHGGTIVKVGTINVKTGKRLTTADVIPPDKRDELLASVRAAVVAKIGGEENLMPSAKEVLAALPENFYVGEDGLHFIFAAYSVAPYHYAPDMYGPVEVVIPTYPESFSQSSRTQNPVVFANQINGDDADASIVQRAEILF